MRNKVKRGFTLVEVALFLAVTGLLFVGIVAGVQNSMFQQKYNDSIQSFAEFLRSVYSQTMNVENSDVSSSGRSEKAIYGKLVTFGEDDSNEIYSYTVIGDIDNSFGSGDTLTELGRLKANVLIKDASGMVGFAGIAEEYFPRWEAGIETTNGWPYQGFKGALLIVRHPRSGTVFTYVLENETVEVRQVMNQPDPDPLAQFLPGEDGSVASPNQFEVKQVDFCVDPEGGAKQSIRRDIRLIAGARNASGVEVIEQNKAKDEGGNQCEP